LLDKAIAEANDGRPLPDWRIHDLRRTLATGLQRLGFSLQTIEAVLGHVSGSRAGVVGLYQRYNFQTEARAALTAWARHVADVVSGKPAKVIPIRTAGRHE
jgi:integrase